MSAVIRRHKHLRGKYSEEGTKGFALEVREGFLQEVAPSWAWKEKQQRRQVISDGRAKLGLRVSLTSVPMKAALLGVWNVYQEHKDHGVGGSVRNGEM